MELEAETNNPGVDAEGNDADLVPENGRPQPCEDRRSGVRVSGEDLEEKSIRVLIRTPKSLRYYSQA